MEGVELQQQFLEEARKLSTDACWRETRPELETLECYLTQPGWLIACDPTHPYHTRLLACLEHLRMCFPNPELRSQLAADVYFRFVGSSSEETNPQEENYLLRTQTVITNNGLRLLRILNTCLWQDPPPDLGERVRAFLEPLKEFDERQRLVRRLSAARWQDFLHLLLGQPSSPQHLRLLADLHRMEYGISLSRSYDTYEPLLGLLRTLFARDLLSYELFCHAVFLRPFFDFMRDGWWAKEDHALRKRVEAYQDRLVGEVAQHLSQENFSVLLAFERPLSGSHWLLAAARAHSNLQPEELVGTAGQYSPRTLAQAIIRLARAQAALPADEFVRAELVTSLRGFPQSTLKALFGVAAHARRILCEALGWREAIPLVELVESLAEPASGEHGADVPDSDGLDVSLVREVLAHVNAALAEEVLDLLVRGKAGVENVATLVCAVGCWNRASVLKGLKHNGLVSIKAYGLLPLTKGEDEVMERYLELQRQARIGQNFGMGRRASHAAAIETAMIHLAQVGGYRDAAHLEWEMEARIVGQATRTESAWTVGAYTLQVVLKEALAAIQITRHGRALKSVPQEVRASVIYRKEAKEALAQMRQHISRVKKGLLERLLATGDPLSSAELSRLLEMPTVRALLSTLIWRDADGTMGLLEPAALALCDLEGTRHPLLGPAIVVHTYHLFQANTLSAWQRFLVHQRIVQPVKQAFRELYVLTPAEQQTGTFSQRFLDHAINGSIALRLLAGRNWRMAGRNSAHPLAYKTLSGMRASLELSQNGHYLGEPGSVAMTGTIFFERLGMAHSASGIVPLNEVPPVIFSEVMRDVDMVVSVAQAPAQENLTYQSPEIYARTGEVVRALLDELQLPGVTIAGHFAFIQGKLTRYRVHLGSAAIHIGPGNYLCIVSTNWGQTHEQLFLPFVDEDTRISEVISKILLLLADDQITDESILRQIKHPR